MKLPPLPGAVIVLEEADEATLGLARALVSPGGHLHLLRPVPPPDALTRWLAPDPWEALERRLAEAEGPLARQARALAEEGFTVSGAPALTPDEEDLSAGLARAGSPLVLVGPMQDEAARREWMALALAPGRLLALVGEGPARPTRHVLLPSTPGLLRVRPLARLRPDAGGPDLTVLHVHEGEAPGGVLRAEGGLAVQDLIVSPGTWSEAVRRLITEKEVDLVLIPLPAPGELGRAALARALPGLEGVSPAPLLLAPGTGEVEAFGSRLEASDLLLLDGELVGACAWTTPFGPPQPAEAPLDLIHPRGARRTLRPLAGCLRWRPDPAELAALPEALGLAAPGEPLATLARVVRPPEGPLSLVDAARVHEAVGEGWWALRLDPDAPLSALERQAGARPLLDASALLDDGPPGDWPPEAGGLRLDRVVRHLRARGLPVRRSLGPGGPRDWPLPLQDPLRELCAAPPSSLSALDLDLDNAAARRRLLDLIAGARARVLLQVYMVHDDAVTREVARALAAAGARGVTVCVLVDSLLSLHGSLGQENPLLVDLAASPGVSVRASRPVAHLPGLVELKARDHRKLLVVDGEAALIGGRNLGAPYLTGFDELALRPDTPYREVPWLDATAAVRGELVQDLEALFLGAWAACGGAPLPPSPRPPPGPLPARLVAHEGLADTHTLDLYRHLIDGARREITVVNTFPLQHELARALHRALARGVRVRLCLGHVRPLHGEPPRPFPGGVVRELATALIHGRVDGLVAAGAEARALSLPWRPPWHPELTRVLPHVHAKLVLVDGERLCVGSANLDVTAAYWESEALLLVEHAPAAAALGARLDALFAEGPRLDPGDPAWQEQAARRGWLARNWPGVVG